MMYKFHRGEKVVGDDRDIDIIIVPGIATPLPEAWNDSTGSWIQALLTSIGPRAQVWIYNYTMLESSTAFMQKVLDEGSDLLQILGALPQTALCTAREHHYQYRKAIDVLCGIVFLGTPHIRPDISGMENVLTHIINSRPRSRLKFKIEKRDQEDLQTLCRDFELANLKVPIISAYEARKTKSLDRRSIVNIWKKRSHIAVGRETCCIRSQNETLLEIDETHDNICRIGVGSAPYSKIEGILRSIVTEAPQYIDERFRPYTGPRSPDQLTLRSKSTSAPIANSKTPQSSQPKAGQKVEGKSTGPEMAAVKTSATSAKSINDILDTAPLPEDFENARRDPILPCFSLKNLERNPGFFGREEELALIDKHLLPPTDSKVTDTRSLRSFGICGMGGLGKTQIAMQYIFTRHSHFDAIFWLPADDKNTLGENFAAIAQRLGLEDITDTQDLTVSRERVKGWLSNPAKSFRNPNNPDNEASWLLVFDNADDLSVLDEYWPLTGRGSVLLTSRDPIGKTSFYTENNGMDISKFSPNDTVNFISFLTKSTPDSDDGKSLRLIAEVLDGLPLAIEQMSSIIRRLRVSYADFLQLYQKENWRLHGLAPEENQGTYQHTLATVWSLQQFSDSSETLLQVLSLLDPDSIPETLLSTYSGKIALNGYPPDMIAYFSARAELMGASLVSLVNQAESQQALALHRLLQEVVLARMDEARMIAVFEAILSVLTSEWPFQSLHQRHTRDRWNQCSLLYPHVAHLKKLASTLGPIKRKASNSIAFAALLSDTGWYLFERGFLEDSREFFTDVQSICEAYEHKHTQAASDLLRECYNNQGTVANETNDPKGALYYFELWEKMLLERRAHNGQIVEDAELAIMHQELAIALAFNENYQESIDRLMKSWSIREKLDDFEETQLLWPVSNLGFIYCEVGRLQEGQNMLERYLKIQADAFGVDDTLSFRTGKCLHALGNIYANQNQMDKSLQLHIRALAQYRVTLGEGHARTAAACYRLAEHYNRLADYDEAEIMIDQAIKVYSARKCHLNELARTLYKRGQILSNRGNKQEANASWLKAYELRRSIVKDDLRPIDEVPEKDYDKLIIFWNR